MSVICRKKCKSLSENMRFVVERVQGMTRAEKRSCVPLRGAYDVDFGNEVHVSYRDPRSCG